MSASKRLAGRRRRGVAIALLLSLSPVRLAAALEADDAAHPTSPPDHVVLVTAGEHGSFSRVVFALGPDRSYRTEPEAAGLRVVVPGAGVGFEYGGVYPGQRAHRVVMAEPGADAGGSSLRLRFGCDCSARTFMLENKLVVDVFDAASRDGRSSPSPAAPTAGADAPPVTEPHAEATADPAPQDVAAGGDQEQPRPEFLHRVDNLSSPAPSVPSGVMPDGAGFNPDHLERMIAWAIEQGHLTGAAERNDPEGERVRAVTAAVPGSTTPHAPAEQPVTPVAQEPVIAPGPSLAEQEPAVVPEPSLAEQEPAAEAAVADACPDAAALDLATSGGSGTFAADLARRQDALSRALAAGHAISEAQHALAGFYLARLMPHEALQLLGTTDQAAPTPAARWLEAAALVLANRTGTPIAQALRASSCPGPDIELWKAVLRAADGALPRQILEHDAIALRLAAYPPELRVELALRLAEAGMHAKAPEAVARLLDMVEQAAPADHARARLLYLRGRLAAARGDFAGARASWREAVPLPGEGGLRATLALLASELEEGALDEAWALSALDRLAYDWRGHPAQLSIARLTAAIHERQGDVPLALRAIEEVALGAEGRPGGRAAARLATDLMRRTYAGAPPALSVDQLAAFWRYEGFVPPGPDGADVRFAFAQILIAHGLPNSAVGLLEPLARDRRGRAPDQLIDLLAEGYLASHQPSRALDVLRAAAEDASASRPARNLLAARAFAALGRFAEAAGVLHGHDGKDAAQLQADYLWKAGLWQEAVTAYRELLQDPQQGRADPEIAVRLAAAAYMADEPEPLERTHGAVEAANAGVDTAVFGIFAPLPTVDSTASRTVAAQLLDQSAGLNRLAERYGLGGTQIQ